MIDIKQELEILILRSGLRSMRKLLMQMSDAGYKVPKSSTMSVQLNKKRIRFYTVADILDYLGYEIEIKPKSK